MKTPDELRKLDTHHLFLEFNRTMTEFDNQMALIMKEFRNRCSVPDYMRAAAQMVLADPKPPQKRDSLL